MGSGVRWRWKEGELQLMILDLLHGNTVAIVEIAAMGVEGESGGCWYLNCIKEKKKVFSAGLADWVGHLHSPLISTLHSINKLLSPCSIFSHGHCRDTKPT